MSVASSLQSSATSSDSCGLKRKYGTPIILHHAAARSTARPSDCVAWTFTLHCITLKRTALHCMQQYALHDNVHTSICVHPTCHLNTRRHNNVKYTVYMILTECATEKAFIRLICPKSSDAKCLSKRGTESHRKSNFLIRWNSLIFITSYSS